MPRTKPLPSQHSNSEISNRTSSMSLSASNRSTKKSKKKELQVGRRIIRINARTLREMKKLQMTTKLLISKASFGRVVREVMVEYGNGNFRAQPATLEALQEAAESFLIQLFEDSYLLTLHRNRITLQPRDIQIALRVRHDFAFF